VTDAVLRQTIAALKPVAGEGARIEARWLIEASNGNLDALIARRLGGEPVDRIIGRRGFWTLDLKVTKDTLSPRPDTETLVDAIFRHPKLAGRRDEALRILDLGTGTGAILLALLIEFPNAQGIGTDISLEALAVAQENAERLGLCDRAAWQQTSWLEGLSGRFNIIVSNPPYIPSGDIAGLDREVRDHDPHLALDGGADGLDPYRIILPGLSPLLAPEGVAALEFGIGQTADLEDIATAAGFTSISIRKDIGGIDRVLVLTTG
jgi:release factor glutamine methyltransferase